MLYGHLNSSTISHIHRNAAGLPVSDRRDGLGDTEGAGVAGAHMMDVAFCAETPQGASARLEVWKGFSETGSDLRVRLVKWSGYYNTWRPHSTLAGRARNAAYGVGMLARLVA